jgi:NADPH:quinone reductase-like Zn-dependent oxidoreductase
VGADGTWAEYIAVAPQHVLPIPDDVDDTAAAALTAATGHLTAYLALTELAAFRPGQSVLAPGVGGGVGQGGVDIARVLGAGAAITTATSTAKAERGRAAGFEVIDLSTESLRDGVHRLTGGRGGTLVSIGYAASTRTEIDVTDLIWKNTHIHGFRFALFTREQINAANTRLLELLGRKEITALVDRVFPLEQAAQAQRHLAEGGPFGRVLLAL